FEIDQVDGHLSALVFIHIPADSPASFERSGNLHFVPLRVFDEVSLIVLLAASRLSNIEGDLVSQFLRFGVQVDVVRNQKLPGTNYGGTGFGVELRRSEIRFEGSILHFLRQRLIFTLSYVRQAFAIFSSGGLGVQIDRDFQFFADALSKPFGKLRAVFHRDTGDGDKWADIG